MSRSFKKNPIFKSTQHGHKKNKRFATKKCRRTDDLIDGSTYRKLFCKKELYKQISYCTLEEFMGYPHLWEIYKTKKDMKQAWRITYYTK